MRNLFQNRLPEGPKEDVCAHLAFVLHWLLISSRGVGVSALSFVPVQMESGPLHLQGSRAGRWTLHGTVHSRGAASQRWGSGLQGGARGVSNPEEVRVEAARPSRQLTASAALAQIASGP